LFGEIVNETIRLNESGHMVERWWFELKHKFPTVETDEFVVMPNHFHGIIVIVGADLRVGPRPEGITIARQGTHAAHQGTHTDVPLPTVVQWFKTMTTNEYISGIKTLRWVPFRGRLWQRNYYEHILRDEESLERVRQYITDNPGRWTSDRENPWATAPDPDSP
jgi:REP element-mobilizing transposase RayT